MTDDKKIFCIGLGKSGTTTLGSCLRILGKRHLTAFATPGLALHRIGDYEKIAEVVEKYDSFDDYPWCFTYKELASRFPDSIFIMTLRSSPERWVQSTCRHYKEHGITDDVLRLGLGCNDPISNKDYLRKFYVNHIDHARKFFKNGWDDRYVELCWEDGDGWDELCNFLAVPKPKINFPHLKWADKQSNEEIVLQLLSRDLYGLAIEFAEKASNGNELIGVIQNHLGERVQSRLKKYESRHKRRKYRYVLNLLRGGK